MKLRALLLAAGLAVAGWQFGQVAWIEAKAVLAQVLLQRAWSASLDDADPHPPWPWADTYPVARLRVDALGVDQIVLAGASGRTLAFGPGHLPASALPGENGTVILAGHRDTHFRFLRELQSGMLVELTGRNGGAQGYRVSRTFIIDARQTQLALTQQQLLILTTCYPFDALLPGGPLRFVVVAKRVSTRPHAAVRL